MSRHIIVGSRRSTLAITQTQWVIDRLEALGLPYTFEIKEIVTKGDQIVDRMLSKVGGKGLFVKEIEQALANQDIDFAVHSMKDVPSVLPPEFTIAAIPERTDPRDCLISNAHLPLAELPSGAVIGTSSLRRSAQVLHQRPDLKVKWIRGNIETRLRKLRDPDEEYDAIILAAAGLERMDWDKQMVAQYLSPDICLPAVGQGALGIECRKDDHELIQLLQQIHHLETGVATRAERSFLAQIEGSCQVPVAGYSQVDGEQVHLSVLVGSPDGETILKESGQGRDPQALGTELAQTLKQRGADEILDQVRAELDS